MDMNKLDIESNNIGGYFSSEHLDLLTIIQCKTQREVIDFVCHCRQLKGVFKEEELISFLSQDLEQLKRYVFASYQNTMVLHDCSKKIALDNTLSRLGLSEEEIDDIKKAYSGVKSIESLRNIGNYIKTKHPNNYEEIIKQIHSFISVERDQNKNENIYDELSILNSNLDMFDTLLIDSGKPEIVINNLLSLDNENKIDFYFAKRDLDFAYRNNKHIRYHTLLSKNACEKLFVGATKEEIVQILTTYVEKTINFINEYNETHKLEDGTPVINAIDLFNEIISFDPMIYDSNSKEWCPYKRIGDEYKVVLDEKKGIYRDLLPEEIPEYKNIWEIKYGITIDDICKVYEYAKKHKPVGVNYLYNEPFLEDDDRRAKVLETLDEIDIKSPDLIDTLGTQMHITIGEDIERIKRCFKDFKDYKDRTGKNIQITEFDMSLASSQIPRVISINGNNPDISLEEIYAYKKQNIELISTQIKESGVKLSGITYWSLTDIIDGNLQRVRSNYLSNGNITNINQIPTVCGGLIPTYKRFLKSNELNQMFNNSNQEVNQSIDNKRII